MARGDEKYRAGLREAGRTPTGRTGEADLEVRLARYIEREFRRRDAAQGTPARTIVAPARPSDIGVGQGTSPAASTNQITLKAIAGEAIGGHRPVYVDENKKARIAKASHITARNVLGITTRAWNAGDEITIVAFGPASESGWSWTPNQPVFVGVNGDLTQIANFTDAFTIIVGFATSQTAMLVDTEPSIARSVVAVVEPDEPVEPLPAPQETYESLVLAGGPTAYYKLDETSGSIINDSSGNGHHGVVVGGVTLGQPPLVSGEPFSASFNGVDGFIDTGLVTPNDSAYSVASWINTDLSAQSTIFTKQHDDPDSNAIDGWAFQARIETNGAIAAYAVDDANKELHSAVAASGAISPNSRHYVVAMFIPNDSLRIYVDAALAATVPISFSLLRRPEPSNSQWFIGRTASSAASGYFVGRQDEFVIYSRALTVQEMQEHLEIGASA